MAGCVSQRRSVSGLGRGESCGSRPKTSGKGRNKLKKQASKWSSNNKKQQHRPQARSEASARAPVAQGAAAGGGRAAPWVQVPPGAPGERLGASGPAEAGRSPAARAGSAEETPRQGSGPGLPVAARGRAGSREMRPRGGGELGRASSSSRSRQPGFLLSRNHRSAGECSRLYFCSAYRWTIHVGLAAS